MRFSRFWMFVAIPVTKALNREGRLQRWWWAAAALAAASAAQGAEDGQWALCAPLPAPPHLTAPPRAEGGATSLSADQAVAQSQTLTTFTGDVVVLRAGKRLEADRAVYDKTADTMDATGNVRYDTENLSLTGERAQMNLGTESGRIEQVRYFFRDLHAFGNAETVLFEDPQRTRLTDATYTTCDPGHQDWLLKARSIDLDEGTNTGEARDLSVSFKGVPFIYLPYINFPLRGRKSGFLVPSYGASERSGTDIAIPYYWNLAPNRDATTTPRYIEKRGTMLLSEFRYLNPVSRGQLNIDALPNDRLYGEDRYFSRFWHQARPAPRWTVNLSYQDVSDPEYFNDLDNTLNTTSITQLERRLDLAYQGDGWRFTGLAQDYQTLSGAEPYRRLPQLRASGATPRRSGRPRYEMDGEFVRFAHRSQVPTGDRVDLKPALSLPLEGAAWFLTPRLAVRYTGYDLRDAIADPRPARTVPITSVDSGLFFERDLTLAGRSLVQTLEPRLFYLYVPYRDQSDIPVFDAATMDFTFAQLFRDNRFSGADRVGDTDQVSAALTTRFLDGESGRELLRAGIGQIAYLKDRKVGLGTSTPDTRRHSDVVGELGARPAPHWDLSADARWNPDENQTKALSFQVKYRRDRLHLLNLAYRYYDDTHESHTDVLAMWPINRRWHTLGRWYYDRANQRSLETLVGLEYESCCWSLRLVGRSKPVFDAAGKMEPDRSYYLTLQLKGLANIGRSLADVIEGGMISYQ